MTCGNFAETCGDFSQNRGKTPQSLQSVSKVSAAACGDFFGVEIGVHGSKNKEISLSSSLIKSPHCTRVGHDFARICARTRARGGDL